MHERPLILRLLVSLLLAAGMAKPTVIRGSAKAAASSCDSAYLNSVNSGWSAWEDSMSDKARW
jgi:hypothetical protein